jgi:hypothetical protein
MFKITPTRAPSAGRVCPRNRKRTDFKRFSPCKAFWATRGKIKIKAARL